MSQLEEIGILRIVDSFAIRHADRRVLEEMCAEALSQPHQATIRAGTLLGNAEYMLPFWEVGLHEIEDFVDFTGRKLLTFAQMNLKHPRAKFDGRHRKAHTLLAYRMGCTPSGGLQPCHQITPRMKRDIENILRDYPERDACEDFRVLGFRVLGFRVLGFRVQGLGF